MITNATTMDKQEAQELLDKIYKNECPVCEKDLAYERLTELISLLLPNE